MVGLTIHWTSPIPYLSLPFFSNLGRIPAGTIGAEVRIHHRDESSQTTEAANDWATEPSDIEQGVESGAPNDLGLLTEFKAHQRVHERKLGQHRPM